MDSILRGLIGHLVQIYSARGEAESSDSGILEAFDDQWVLLDRGGEKLYFSLSRVRLIKPL